MEGGWFSLGLSFFPLLHLHRGGWGIGNGRFGLLLVGLHAAKAYTSDRA